MGEGGIKYVYRTSKWQK